MRFISTSFPNLCVYTQKGPAQFAGGVYDTKDEQIIKEIKQLNLYGVVSLDEVQIDATPLEVVSTKREYKIPVRWSEGQIREFAAEEEIEIPENITTKKELREYIESL